MEKEINREKNQRVVTFLNRQEVDLLDRIGKDALFSTGLKLSRTKLISWLIDFMEELRISGNNIKSKEDFENRIKNALPLPDETVTKTAAPGTSPVESRRDLYGASHGIKEKGDINV